MFVYSYCRQDNFQFRPFYRLDTAIDFALNNIEQLIGRAELKTDKKAKLSYRAFAPNAFDMEVAPADQVVVVQPNEPQPVLNFADLNLGGPLPVVPGLRKKKKAASLTLDNPEELDKLFKQIDATRAKKTMENVVLTIQMAEDYMRFTRSAGAIRHSIEEVKSPNIKERQRDDDIDF